MPSVMMQRLLGAVSVIVIVSVAAPFVWRASDSGLPPEPLVIQWPKSVSGHKEKQDAVSVKDIIIQSTTDASVVENTKSAPVITEGGGLVHSTQPKKDQSASPAWIIQLATFKQLANAKRLVSKLQSKGYAAYFRQEDLAKGGQLVRVYVGPIQHREDGDQLLSQLLTENGLRGIIMRDKKGQG